MRHAFYLILAFLYILGLYGRLYHACCYEVPFAIVFVGSSALLIRNAWIQRRSLWALPSLLLLAKILANLSNHTPFDEASRIFRNLGGTLFPVTGLLLLITALNVPREGLVRRYLMLNAFSLILSFPVEYRPYFEQIEWIESYSRISYLLVFGVFVLTDFSKVFEDRSFILEKNHLRIGLFVVVIQYFTEFIFV